MKAIVELKFFDISVPLFENMADEIEYLKEFISDNLFDSEMTEVTEYFGDIDNQCEIDEGDQSLKVIMCIIVDLKDEYVTEWRQYKMAIMRHIQSALGIVPLEFQQDWKCGNDHYILLSLEPENLERFHDL